MINSSRALTAQFLTNRLLYIKRTDIYNSRECFYVSRNSIPWMSCKIACFQLQLDVMFTNGLMIVTLLFGETFQHCLRKQKSYEFNIWGASLQGA